MGGEGSSETDVAPLVVRFGFRPAGVVLLLGWIASGLAMFAVAILMLKDGVDSAFSAGVFFLSLIGGLALFGLVAFVLISMDTRREIAVLSPAGVDFCRVQEPAPRSWEWSEIAKVAAIGESSSSIQTAMVFDFDLHDQRRFRAMEYAVPPAGRADRYWFGRYRVSTIRVTLFHTPSPRVISRYIYSVAPELGLELIPPRHRPKGYPWRDIGGDGSA